MERRSYPDELHEEVLVAIDGRRVRGHRFVPRGTWTSDLDYARFAQRFASLTPREQWQEERGLVERAARARFYDPEAFARVAIDLAKRRARAPVARASPSDRIRVEVGVQGGAYVAIEVPRESANAVVYGAGVTTGALIFGAALGPAVLAGVLFGILFEGAATPRRQPPQPRRMNAYPGASYPALADHQYDGTGNAPPGYYARRGY